jgi:hypothetical protein
MFPGLFSELRGQSRPRVLDHHGARVYCVDICSAIQKLFSIPSISTPSVENARPGHVRHDAKHCRSLVKRIVRSLIYSARIGIANRVVAESVLA